MRNRPHRRVSAELYRVVKFLAVDPYEAESICEVTMISTATLEKIMSTDTYEEYRERFQKRSKRAVKTVNVVPRFMRLAMSVQALIIVVLVIINLIK